MSYDFNEAYKAYLRRCVEQLGRQAKSWSDEAVYLVRFSCAGDGLRRKQYERKARLLARMVKKLKAVEAEYWAELREQEKWGLPGLVFDGSEGAEGWSGMRLHSVAADTLEGCRVKLVMLTERERAEAEHETKLAMREERRRKQREARKAEEKRKAAAVRKATRRRARRSGVARKGGCR